MRLTSAFEILYQVAVIGSGWAGFRMCLDLDKELYDVVCISPRNHFLFTPLLPSTAVGTLEFRCIQEPGEIKERGRKTFVLSVTKYMLCFLCTDVL